MAVKDKNTPELLSPAGDWDSLTAAVINGADAVYLGVKAFNARRYARNFTVEDLTKVTDYTHRHGVRVYLTLNTLVKNSEFKSFFETLSRAFSTGIDGVIIQHVSFLEIIKRNYPGLKVFLSTQAAVGVVAAASLFKSADRIILPRELPLAEIKRFSDAGYKTEVFVHGALCYSYSGLCLFSSFVGSRSGNRGSCAQLCRQRYNGTYPLSTKELCLVNRVPELIEAGIDGFKIEGRMRSPLYVSVATRLYRQAIDSYTKNRFKVPENAAAEIEVVFNREFTEGLMTGDQGIISSEKPMNRGAFLGKVANEELKLSRSLAVGDGIGIWQGTEVTGSIIKKIVVRGKEVQSAGTGETINIGISIAEGARVYLTSSPRINIQPDFIIKRPPLTGEKRAKSSVNLPLIKPAPPAEIKLLVKAYSWKEAAEAIKEGADLVFLNIFAPDSPENNNWPGYTKLGVYIPRILNDSELKTALQNLKRRSPAAILTGNAGFLPHRHEFKIPVYADYSLNTFNDLDIRFLHNLDVIPVISPELSLNELLGLKNKSVAVLCHGDIVLVNTLIDPGCAELKDEKGSIFPVRKENRYWQILNSRPYGLFNDIQHLLDAGFSQFYIDMEGKGAESAALYRRILDRKIIGRNARKGYTSGHLYKPVL